MYHLFSGQNYYPESGLGDYVNAFETQEEAEEIGRQKCGQDGTNWQNDWWVVVTEVDGRLTTVSRGSARDFR